jgi:Phage Mu protein F like protein
VTWARLSAVDDRGGVYVRLCSCHRPGLAKAARRDTVVAGYVNAKAPKLARRLRPVLAAFGRAYARKLAAKYRPPAEKLSKAMADDERDRLLASLDSDALGEELTGELTGAMTAAFRRAAARGAAQVGFSSREATKQADLAAVKYAKERGAELIADLAGTTEEAMAALIGRAVEEGFSTDELADAVEKAGAFGEARAEVIARTELAHAHVQGNVEGWKATGLGVRKKAILGDLHDVEDICDECADAGVVDMDDDFVEGYAFPPFHPNCICDVEPVLPEEEDGGE